MATTRRALCGVLIAVAAVLANGPADAETGPAGVWPLRPRPEVVTSFNPPDSPWGSGHRGVDLLGRPGQQVYAAMDGTIRFVGRVAGKPVVVVDHGSTRTSYEPVTSAAAVGDPVAAGAALGVLEVTQSHCFPRACLHWGWIDNSDDHYLDPLDLVGAGPVRLLPQWRPVAALPSAGSASRSRSVLAPFAWTWAWLTW